MTTERAPPRVRERTRRVIQIDDAPLLGPAQPQQPPTDEGRFDYGDSFSPVPAIRYRQIKSIEGRSAAKEWAKDQMLRMAFSGGSPQDIAKTFGFSLRWTLDLLEEARLDVKVKMGAEFDGMALVAEHMVLYQSMRQSAFFAMNKSGVSEVDKHRARDSLLNVMSKEMEFVKDIGGLRGVSLATSAEDESVLAARALSDRLKTLTDDIEDILGVGDDELVDEAEDAEQQDTGA